MTPGTTSEWLVAAVLAKAQEGYNLIIVHRTENLNWCSFKVKITLQVMKKNIKLLPDKLSIVEGKRLNELDRDRLPLCNQCETQVYIKKNCIKLTKVIGDVAQEVAETSPTIEIMQLTVEGNEKKSVVESHVVREVAAADLTAEDECKLERTRKKKGNMTRGESK